MRKRMTLVMAFAVLGGVFCGGVDGVGWMTGAGADSACGTGGAAGLTGPGGGGVGGRGVTGNG